MSAALAVCAVVVRREVETARGNAEGQTWGNRRHGRVEPGGHGNRLPRWLMNHTAPLH
jgi:hypothetical protein